MVVTNHYADLDGFTNISVAEYALWTVYLLFVFSFPVFFHGRNRHSCCSITSDTRIYVIAFTIFEDRIYTIPRNDSRTLKTQGRIRFCALILYFVEK